MRGILRPLPSKESHRETIEKIHTVSRERVCGDGRLRELVKRELSSTSGFTHHAFTHHDAQHVTSGNSPAAQCFFILYVALWYKAPSLSPGAGSTSATLPVALSILSCPSRSSPVPNVYSAEV